ncbi:MAG: hypothetical protein KDC35_10305 [Acidobacteria bacterium]|nr:hypothetical protein [Acidobacteriota bacterium]
MGALRPKRLDPQSDAFYIAHKMILTPELIDRLLAQEPITDLWPWASGNEQAIEDHWKDIVHKICRRLTLRFKAVFNHYGSGYASYVDTWFYREDPAFKIGPDDCYSGLVVLYSRLSPYYVLGEGAKCWHSRGGSSYLPHFHFLDQFSHPAVKELIPEVDAIMAQSGLQRLFKTDLAEAMPTSTAIPTILADAPWVHFDALFYWED